MLKSVKRQLLRASMGEWLSMYDWCSFGTLTFRPEYGTKDGFTAIARFERFVKDVNKRFRCNIKYAVFVEKFDLSDEVHLHFLWLGLPGDYLKGFENDAYKDVFKMWFDQWGRCKIIKYIRDRGAEYYLTKYITKGFSNWRIKINE